MHELFLASDDSQNIITVLFIDFTKAFDVIDHNVLLNKFVDCARTRCCTVFTLQTFSAVADSLSELQILFLVPLLLRLELHKALFLGQMTLSS